MKPKSSLSKNVMLNSFYQVLLVVVPLITAPYVSRVLQADGIGVFSYTHSIVTYFTLFAALGTIAYGTREIARIRDDKAAYSSMFWEIELLVICTTTICLLLWLPLALFYTEYRPFLLILSIQILAVCFDISWLYAGVEKFQYTVIINSFFKILGCVSIFLFVKKPEDLWIYFLINSLVILLGNMSMWMFLPKTVSKATIHISNTKKHLRGTIVFFVPAIAASIYTMLDKTLIGLLIPGTITTVDESGQEITKKIAELESGYYEQATKIINIIKAVAFVGIVGVMTSRASYLHATGNKKGVKDLLKLALNITSFLSFGACFGLAAIAKTFVPTFFGGGYEPSIIIIYILSPLIFIISISNVLGGVYYTPVGKRKQSAIYLIVGAALNLLLNIPFILLWNAKGAAIASLAAECLIATLYMANCDRMISFKELILLTWKKLIAGAVMFICVFTFTFYFESRLNSLLLLGIQLLIGLIVYCLLLLLVGDSSIKEIFSFFKTADESESNNTSSEEKQK